jgi:hypothetical protein
VDGLTRTAEILMEIVPVNAALVKRVSSRGRRVPFGRPEPGRNLAATAQTVTALEIVSPRNTLLHLLRASW